MGWCLAAAAQEAVKSIFEVFTWGLKSPLEFCLLMDDLRHLVNGMKWTSINRDATVNAMSQAIGPRSVRSFKDLFLASEWEWYGMTICHWHNIGYDMSILWGQEIEIS
jgi:hypothetical protein